MGRSAHVQTCKSVHLIGPWFQTIFVLSRSPYHTCLPLNCASSFSLSRRAASPVLVLTRLPFLIRFRSCKYRRHFKSTRCIISLHAHNSLHAPNRRIPRKIQICNCEKMDLWGCERERNNLPCRPLVIQRKNHNPKWK